MSAFKDSLKDLTQRQMDFICEELKKTPDEIAGMNDDQLYDEVYDAMCDIEIAETPADDSKMSERCKLASDIVTVMGNALAKDEGVWDEESFLKDLEAE